MQSIFPPLAAQPFWKAHADGTSWPVGSSLVAQLLCEQWYPGTSPPPAAGPALLPTLAALAEGTGCEAQHLQHTAQMIHYVLCMHCLQQAL